MNKRITGISVLALWLLVSRAIGQTCEKHFSLDVKIATGELYFSTPPLDHVSFVKAIRHGFIGYYIFLKYAGRFGRLRPKGATIVLADGSKIYWSAYPIEKQIDSFHTFGDGKYQFSAFLPLSIADVNRIAVAGITNFRLSVSEHYLTTEQQTLIRQRAACILTIE